jgi:hypothetical protein
MNTLTIEATADLLATATIAQSIDMGQFIAHKGIAADGTAFMLVNGMSGVTIITKL